jgi:hypothetical protein
MKNIRLLSIGFLFLLFCSSVTWGQTADYFWNFGTVAPGDSNLTSGTLPNVTVSPVSVGNIFGDSLAYGSMLDSGVPSTGYGGASGGYKAVQAARIGSLVNTPGGSAYFEIILTPAAGYAVTVNSIQFGNRSTATGPSAYAVRTDKDQYTANIASGTVGTISAWELAAPSMISTPTGIAGVPLHVRIYGYAGSGQAQPGSLNWNIDDLDLNVTVGSASATPYLSVNPWTLTGFEYLVSSLGPSATQTDTLTGVGLDGTAVTVLPPANFEVSTNNGSTWNTASFTVTYTAPNLSQVLTIRLAASKPAGPYSGNIQCSGGGSTGTKNIILSGYVTSPTLTWAQSTNVNTSYVLGQGPSGVMTYTIAGTNLGSGSVTVTATTNFEVTVDSVTWGSSKTIPIVSNAVATTKVFLRLKGGLSIGSYSGTLTASGGGAPSVNAPSGGGALPANTSLAGSVTAGGLLFNEDFSYASGSALHLDDGWFAHSALGLNPQTIGSSGLSYPGLKGSGIGNADTVKANNEDDNHQFTNVNYGTVYASAMIKVTAATTAGDYFIHFSDASTFNFYARTFIKSTTGGFLLGISKYNGTQMYSPTVYHLNDTLLIVLKYTYVNNNQKDSSDYVNLFVNPTPGGTEPAPDLTSGGSGWTTGSTQWQGADAANLSGIFLRQGGATIMPTVIVDGIKIGQTWANVTTPSTQTLNLTAFLQGYTNTGGTAMNFAPANVKVELHNATSPYAGVDTTTGSLNTAGVGTFTFTKLVGGTSYYIVVKTWNTLETWSAAAQSFTPNATYDFTSLATQAYASNMIQIGSKWCIFSGDVNQDGFSNSTDYNQINNDSYNLVHGVVVTDLTGDQFTNSSDYNIVNNNSYNLVKARTPLLNPSAGMSKPPVMVNRPQMKNEK